MLREPFEDDTYVCKLLPVFEGCYFAFCAHDRAIIVTIFNTLTDKMISCVKHVFPQFSPCKWNAFNLNDITCNITSLNDCTIIFPDNSTVNMDFRTTKVMHDLTQFVQLSRSYMVDSLYTNYNLVINSDCTWTKFIQYDQYRQKTIVLNVTLPNGHKGSICWQSVLKSNGSVLSLIDFDSETAFECMLSAKTIAPDDDILIIKAIIVNRLIDKTLCENIRMNELDNSYVIDISDGIVLHKLNVKSRFVLKHLYMLFKFNCFTFVDYDATDVILK